MTTVQNVVDAIGALAPWSLALSWDNSGLQAGDPAAPVARALVALDATKPVIQEAKERGAQLVVTHHPLLFHPCSSLTPDHPAFWAVREGIAVVSAHTNYDLVPGGVSHQLAAALGMTGVEPLPSSPGEEPVCGVWGELPQELAPGQLAQALTRILGVTPRRNPLERPIRRLGLCGGAGADGLAAAQAVGCQAFLTGEVKHHQFLQAQAMGMVLLDGSHYATEALALPALAQALHRALPELEVLLAGSYQGEILG